MHTKNQYKRIKSNQLKELNNIISTVIIGFVVIFGVIQGIGGNVIFDWCDPSDSTRKSLQKHLFLEAFYFYIFIIIWQFVWRGVL